MILYYKIKHTIIETYYQLKCKIQRFKRGYAYGDVWDMDQWFIDTIKPMLIHLKEHGCSYPMEFKDRDEWCAVLNEMIACLELMNEDDVIDFLDLRETSDFLKMSHSDHVNVRETMNNNKNKFFELFSKYFYDMWD